MLVIVSNMKIIISTFLIGGLILFVVIASVAFYFLIFWLESIGENSNQYGTLTMMMMMAG